MNGFHGLPPAYIPILMRVQNTYWPAKDKGHTTCEISLKGLHLPGTMEEARQRVQTFLGVTVTPVPNRVNRLRLYWSHTPHLPHE